MIYIELNNIIPVFLAAVVTCNLVHYTTIPVNFLNIMSLKLFSQIALAVPGKDSVLDFTKSDGKLLVLFLSKVLFSMK